MPSSFVRTRFEAMRVRSTSTRSIARPLESTVFASTTLRAAAGTKSEMPVSAPETWFACTTPRAPNATSTAVPGPVMVLPATVTSDPASVAAMPVVSNPVTTFCWARPLPVVGSAAEPKRMPVSTGQPLPGSRFCLTVAVAPSRTHTAAS
jgi:hypothetical protein